MNRINRDLPCPALTETGTEARRFLPKRQAAGKGGADFIAICTNTMHKVAPEIILGCTEIGLLIRQSDTDIPLFDTTLIHARGAALYAVE